MSVHSRRRHFAAPLRTNGSPAAKVSAAVREVRIGMVASGPSATWNAPAMSRLARVELLSARDVVANSVRFLVGSLIQRPIAGGERQYVLERQVRARTGWSWLRHHLVPQTDLPALGQAVQHIWIARRELFGGLAGSEHAHGGQGRAWGLEGATHEQRMRAWCSCSSAGRRGRISSAGSEKLTNRTYFMPPSRPKPGPSDPGRRPTGRWPAQRRPRAGDCHRRAFTWTIAQACAKQRQLRLKDRGFVRHGRNWNRTSGDLRDVVKRPG